MDLRQDFKELLACFNRSGVEYIVVGGYAVAFHGSPRYTGDLDLYVNPTRVNAGRIMDALLAFGFGGLDLGEDDFSAPGKVVQLGVPPMRVDIVTSIDRVEWEEAWDGRCGGTYGNERLFFIGKRELVKNKRALGRSRDLADLEALGER